MTEGRRGPGGEQDRGSRSPSPTSSPVVRVPLAVAFPLVGEGGGSSCRRRRGSDLLDGFLARRVGSSRFGPVIDPVADKLFMAVAFGTVFFSGRTDVVGTGRRARARHHRHRRVRRDGGPGPRQRHPARAGGKAVTFLQVTTLFAFVLDSPFLRPLAWATAAVALYAIWDYTRAARTSTRPV